MITREVKVAQLKLSSLFENTPEQASPMLVGFMLPS